MGLNGPPKEPLRQHILPPAPPVLPMEIRVARASAPQVEVKQKTDSGDWFWTAALFGLI